MKMTYRGDLDRVLTPQEVDNNFKTVVGIENKTFVSADIDLQSTLTNYRFEAFSLPIDTINDGSFYLKSELIGLFPNNGFDKLGGYGFGGYVEILDGVVSLDSVLSDEGVYFDDSTSSIRFSFSRAISDGFVKVFGSFYAEGYFVPFDDIDSSVEYFNVL